MELRLFLLISVFSFFSWRCWKTPMIATKYLNTSSSCHQRRSRFRFFDSWTPKTEQPRRLSALSTPRAKFAPDELNFEAPFARHGPSWATICFPGAAGQERMRARKTAARRSRSPRLVSSVPCGKVHCRSCSDAGQRKQRSRSAQSHCRDFLQNAPHSTSHLAWRPTALCPQMTRLPGRSTMAMCAAFQFSAELRSQDTKRLVCSCEAGNSHRRWTRWCRSRRHGVGDSTPAERPCDSPSGRDLVFSFSVPTPPDEAIGKLSIGTPPHRSPPPYAIEFWQRTHCLRSATHSRPSRAWHRPHSRTGAGGSYYQLSCRSFHQPATDFALNGRSTCPTPNVHTVPAHCPPQNRAISWWRAGVLARCGHALQQPFRKPRGFEAQELPKRKKKGRSEWPHSFRGWLQLTLQGFFFHLSFAITWHGRKQCFFLFTWAIPQSGKEGGSRVKSSWGWQTRGLGQLRRHSRSVPRVSAIKLNQTCIQWRQRTNFTAPSCTCMHMKTC